MFLINLLNFDVFQETRVQEATDVKTHLTFLDIFRQPEIQTKWKETKNKMQKKLKKI